MEHELPEAVQKVQTAVLNFGGREAVRFLPESAATAADAASTLGVPLERIGKTIVFLVGNTVVAVIIGGNNRVSEHSLAAAVLGDGKVKRLSAAGVKEQTGFPIGGVSPFGLPDNVKIFLDRDLLKFDSIYVAAGHPKAVLRTEPLQIIEWARAEVADLAERK